MNSPKKILFVAGNVEHLYQFVIHGFFKELSETSSIYLTMPERELSDLRWVEMSAHLDGVFTEVIPYKYSDRSKKYGYQLGASLTYRHRKSATGYQIKILESLFGGLDIPLRLSSRRSLKVILKNRREIFRRFLHEFPAMARSTQPIHWAWSKFKTHYVIRGCTVNAILHHISPDASVTLMQRQAGFVIASLAAGDKYQIPTILIPYKWDNASSKSPLIKKPTKMLVFNLAIKEVCARLHKMPVNDVVAVGSPEISLGKSSAKKSPGKTLPLIGATINPMEAAIWIECINSLLCDPTFSLTMGEYHAVWRPYPNQSEINVQRIREFIIDKPRICVDEDIVLKKSHRSDGVSFGDVNKAYMRYVSLLDSAVAVVSEGTSVIVDARARGIAVIYPAFKQNAVIGSQWHRLNTSEHLKGLRETKGVFIAEDEEELKRLVVDFLENPRRIPPNSSGENIFVDERTYAQRVLDVIDDAIAEKSKQRD